MKRNFLLSSLFTAIASMILFAACSSNETESVSDDVNASNIKGLVEKGPFVAGSTVNVYELDDDLKATGRVFKTETDKTGAFAIKPSSALKSKFVKLTVNGFYFNEYTGKLSDAPISLDAISTIDQSKETEMNVNILTHLEAPRVMKLMEEGKKFDEAKKQAQKDVLKAFLITEETVIPETTTITGNNTSANILIAISSILLNERSDAQFTEFMSELRSDLEKGEATESSKSKIATSSLGLKYSKIKKHIEDRYKELGQTIEVGDFELFIDGDGNGKIGEPYKETEDVAVDDTWKNESQVRAITLASLSYTHKFMQDQYLFDAVYTNTLPDSLFRYSWDLKNIYDHRLTPDTYIAKSMFTNAYTSIRYDNVIIAKANESKEDWFKSYANYAKVYRAYKYVNMVDLWGDMPLVTQELNFNSADSLLYPSRTPIQEVLNFVIQDMEDVYQLLPNQSKEWITSKYFAKAIQAKAYLKAKNYAKAIEAANLIINSNVFALSNNVNDIYSGANNEQLFSFPNQENSSHYQFKEWLQKGDNIVLCRYAEILLIAAEAHLHLGNTHEAINKLNLVRLRNGRQAITDSSKIEEAILEEWKSDFAKEGLYFFALKRFNRAEKVLDISRYQLLLPIPQSEIYNNRNMKQNPGY